ncbi:endonuclease/exonuclease/phosphatase family protein [Kribbella qitaiheensis]|uniref:endonuclease/exonuclease/phosphatase family protein n=1 Tax=Kribbella qitaiheensis TaxID=1544730 RepID=UPI00362242E5
MIAGTGLAAAVEIPGRGEQLFVVPTTPWRPEHEAAREKQARDITDLDARHRTALPTIVAGGFDAGPSSPSIRYLTRYFDDAWAVAGNGPGYTWTVDNPVAAEELARLLGDPDRRRRIDYILTRCAVRSVELVGDDPVEGVWLSDHFGVLAEL